MSPKVGIIVRTKDRPILLKRCLESIQSQEFRDWEILLVNNGGDIANVEKVINLFPEEFKAKINLINLTESNYMEFATNAGINAGNSSYITLLDDDDTWHPLFLKKCVNFLELRDEIDGVVTRACLVNEVILEGNIKEISKSDFNPRLKKLRLYHLARCNRFTTNSFVYRRSILNHTGLYCDKLPVLGDWEFNIRFCRIGTIYVIPETLAYYHKRLQETRQNYGNTTVDLHLKYDSIVRKKYWSGSLRQGDYFFAFLLVFNGIFNAIIRKIKSLM